MRTLAIVLILVVLAVALPSGAPSAQEYVVVHFKCPPYVTYTVNWQDKIKTGPTDFRLAPSYAGNMTHSAMFEESAVKVPENIVQCRYGTSPTHIFGAPYVHKVHRIISCTGQPGSTIVCKLKPK